MAQGLIPAVKNGILMFQMRFPLANTSGQSFSTRVRILLPMIWHNGDKNSVYDDYKVEKKTLRVTQKPNRENLTNIFPLRKTQVDYQPIKFRTS